MILSVLALLSLSFAGFSNKAVAEDAKAPIFKLSNQDGAVFDLENRRGKGWTVLYFYPKADTPGCTKQACAFRDAVDQITELDAEVYGISTDSQKSLKKFHSKYRLKFPLLSDEEGEISRLYDTKMPIVTISKRWTFIIDPDLNIRSVDKDVDPALDAKKVADKLRAFQK